MNRKVLFFLRFAALGAMILLRGRKRFAARAVHDALWLYPTLKRNCSWHGPVITGFHTTLPEVWLTIDDGPDPRDTPGILEALRKHNATASFFVIGRKVDAHRSLCRKIVAGGHTLENHSHTHSAALFWSLPCCLMQNEIDHCTHSILTATGIAPRFFRPPVGMCNPCVHPATSKRWLRVAGWSATGLDGLPNPSPDVVLRRIMNDIRPGGIIMLHESGKSGSRVETIELLLERLSEKGYRCVIPQNSQLY